MFQPIFQLWCDIIQLHHDGFAILVDTLLSAGRKWTWVEATGLEAIFAEAAWRLKEMVKCRRIVISYIFILTAFSGPCLSFFGKRPCKAILLVFLSLSGAFRSRPVCYSCGDAIELDGCSKRDPSRNPHCDYGVRNNRKH